jgi:hypothetical protein
MIQRAIDLPHEVLLLLFVVCEIGRREGATFLSGEVWKGLQQPILEYQEIGIRQFV